MVKEILKTTFDRLSQNMCFYTHIQRFKKYLETQIITTLCR